MRIVHPPPDQTVVLEEVSWEELEKILAEIEEHPWRRVAYEGDETFYITNEKRIRKSGRIDFQRDPPPDLAVPSPEE